MVVQLKDNLQQYNIALKSIKTVFIGGGTPSTLPPKSYNEFFEIIKPYLKDGAEITSEVNPNSASIEWLSGMKKHGVNRLSFGVQSFNEEKLKQLGRAHDKTQAMQAIKLAKEVGFEHISLDLIYNATGDTKELIKNDIDIAFSLPIDHISAYELTIEAGTVFENQEEQKQTNDDLAFFVASEITKRGYTHYEISNFGSYQSVHNKGYWELDNYLGIGAGAVGYINGIRYYPYNDIDAYIANPIYATNENLSKNDLLTEKIFLGLRSVIGVAKNLLSDYSIRKANYLVEQEKLIFKDEHYYNLNFFLSDEIALYIME
jgi:oxygen-independent coproporphyrinogen-3 oxidase